MAETNLEKIKDTVRKLMAVANDGAATPAEIENYMKMAASLIDKHHLDPAEVSKTEQDITDQKMGRSAGKTTSSKFHRWETTLASAIETLFGCVKHYLDGKSIPLRVNGAVQFYTGKYAGQMKMCRQFVFYGPALEAQEAAELYSEWAQLIATMGVIRWGGAYRGDGEMYCQGFSEALLEQAYSIDENRKKLTAKLPTLLEGETAPQTTAITLRARYEVLQQRASNWLEKNEGIKLGKGAGRQGSNSGSSDAYREGVTHGRQAGFGRATKAKRLEGPKS